MLLEFPIIFYFLLPIIALLYASVGHGGASGYLALMAIFNAEPYLMKPTALILNLFVAGISFFLFWREGYFKWKLFWPFAITSVPMAFLGGYLNVDPDIYKKVLAILLIFSVIRIIGFDKEIKTQKEQILWQSLLIGLIIGFFSGLIGIGGGIILSPVILLLHWGNMKETAAVSALFIWINSFAGLSGMYLNGLNLSAKVLFLVGITLTGALIGAYAGSMKLNNLLLKRVLALVLVMASIKLFFT